MAKTVLRGYGLQVNLDDITEEAIYNSITEILTNPKFRENAEIISRRFTDRPMTPQESVVYWTEYVAKHNGAAHLKAQSVSLSFIEFHLIDVYCTLFVICAIGAYIKFLIFRAILRKIFKKNSQKKEKKS